MYYDRLDRGETTRRSAKRGESLPAAGPYSRDDAHLFAFVLTLAAATHEHTVVPVSVLWFARSALTMIAVSPRIPDAAQLLVTDVAFGVMASLNKGLADAHPCWLGLVIKSTGTVEDPVSGEMDWRFGGGTLRCCHDASVWSKCYTCEKVQQQQVKIRPWSDLTQVVAQS